MEKGKRYAQSSSGFFVLDSSGPWLWDPDKKTISRTDEIEWRVNLRAANDRLNYLEGIISDKNNEIRQLKDLSETRLKKVHEQVDELNSLREQERYTDPRASIQNLIDAMKTIKSAIKKLENKSTL